MNWQLFVYTRLSLNDLSPKVISDYTGILSAQPFLSFLEEKNIKFLITDNIPEMVSAVGKGVSVILTSQREIPNFISRYFTHLRFSYADIPLNGETAPLLKNKTKEEIVNLLDYVFNTNQHVVLTKHNIQELSLQSSDYTHQKELQQKLQDVLSITQEEPETENLLQLGRLWGRVVFLSNKLKSSDYLEHIPAVDSFSKSFFFSGKMEHVFYASTVKSPKTVDRILPYIKNGKEAKVAIICFDCMGYAEWYLLKDFLEKKFQYSEIPLFSMLPSVTKFSRTAIFRASRDVYSIKSPGRADEAKAFTSFFSGKQAKYFTEDDEISDSSILGYETISILYTFFDDLSHSTQFPSNERSKALYFNAVKAYLEKTDLVNTLNTLQKNNFAVYFCSDHGSVIAYGNGQKLDRYLVDSFAKRAAIVPKASEELVHTETVNVPFHNEILVALPEGRTMFANRNQIEINHGGITVEEMVVPFIKVQ